MSVSKNSVYNCLLYILLQFDFSVRCCQAFHILWPVIEFVFSVFIIPVKSFLFLFF